jgi:Domain of unknown function (DUF6265)
MSRLRFLQQAALLIPLFILSGRLGARPAELASSVRPFEIPYFPFTRARVQYVTPATLGSVEKGSFSRQFSAADFSARDPQSDKVSPPSTGQLTDLSWLAGHWLGKWGPRTAEQIWMPPRGGLMLGTFRLYEDDQTLLVELFTVAQRQDGIELSFRHFTPELVPWEKSPATVLTLETVGSDRIVFTNPRNGQPKRAIFIRVDENTYISRSEVVSSTGTAKVVDITFHREQPTAPRAHHH